MDIQGFFTSKGLLLAAKLTAGSVLKITRVCAGAAETALSASALSQIRQTLSVGAARRSGVTAVLPVTLEAGMAGSSYTLRELGVYAQDPDEGEILYKVYRLSEPVEVKTTSRMVLRFYLEETVSQDLNVTVVRASAGLLTEADLDPVREKVEAAAVPIRTVELAAAELPGYIASLPRLLTENLTVNVSGTLTTPLKISSFYGSGRLGIVGRNGFSIQGQVQVTLCQTPIQIVRADIQAVRKEDNAVAEIVGASMMDFTNCSFTGGGTQTGVLSNASTIYLLNCGIRNCATAVQASATGRVILCNETNDAALYGDNGIGAMAYRGGLVTICGAAPEMLGGSANGVSGGAIITPGSIRL